ncbi:unnamed protein product [Phyllotreta striolata]|uniref:PDZ GRASP-type domain-containing protein n=1 Tax=Phyllotreta striolata TaxID=444603 RepID=A0A9N9TFA3_PHYSR|nr:unnamed protein product [Phyllotreta striolata]
MGNSESVDIPGGGTEGYHVLRVQENSPASKAGLQPFFDFIVSINGTRLDKDNDTLKTILKNGIGKQLPLAVYSCKTQGVRSVTIEPSDTWGGQGLLGISIKFCSFEVAKENVWHILEVHPNSPASMAGLKPFTDYIISSDSILYEREDLYNLIEGHDGISLKLYVYNSDEDRCREVNITPNSRWGGDGLVGCSIGYGYLHRIPVRSNVIQPPPTTTIFNQVPTVSPNKNETSNMTTTESINNLIQNTENLTLLSQNPVAPTTSTVSTTAESPVSQPSSMVFTSNVPAPSSIPNFSNYNIQVPPASEAPASEVSKYFDPSLQQPIVNPLMYNPADYSVGATNLQYTNSQMPPPLSPIQVQSGAPQAFSPTTSAPAGLPPPPLSGFQNQPIIFDPHIAAQSAQQLLSGNLINTSKPSQIM